MKTHSHFLFNGPKWFAVSTRLDTIKARFVRESQLVDPNSLRIVSVPGVAFSGSGKIKDQSVIDEANRIAKGFV